MRKFTPYLLLLIPILTALSGCMTFRMSSKEIERYFVLKNVPVVQESYRLQGRTIQYVVSGNYAKPLVLFVHGSPGSLSAFIHFLADTILLDDALLVTADRPGFGYSNFGNAEPSLKKQAALLKPILERYQHNRPIILVGHSLGGPLISRMAIDYPELVDGLIIVAGSIDPELEPNETWFRAPLATPFLSWLLPRSIRASNEEIYQLKPQLEELLPLWKQIKCPSTIIHGTKDSLVPAGNAAFAQRMLVNVPPVVQLAEGVDHFIPWSHPELIRAAIVNMLQQPAAVVSGN